MSQTTRCPACQTRFKVVADQLRISDGWVRCGHCQQVFDATLSLQSIAPEPMLPDLPLDRLRGPVDRAAHAAPVARAWGGGAAPAAAAPPMDAAKSDDETWKPHDGFVATQPGVLDQPGLESPALELPELDEAPKPQSHIPSFLKAPAPLEPAFLAAPSIGFAVEQAGSDAVGRVPASMASGVEPLESNPKTEAAGEAEHAVWKNSWWGSRARTQALPATGVPPPMPGGYELPAAEPDEVDSDWPALFDETPDATDREEAASADPPSDAADLDLAHFIAEVAEPPAEPVASHTTSSPEPLQDIESVVVPNASLQALSDVPGDIEESSWSLVQEGAAPADASLLNGPGWSSAPVSLPPEEVEFAPATALAVAPAGAEDEPAPSDMELSFMRSARRRAFWSGTGVRLGLALIAMGLLLALLGQIAFHERAGLAVLWPQSRPVLESACAYLQCSVGMHRDIEAVLVDGSAFNRVQGDRYQFSLTLRNRAALPVETPAIELTLTDAQDQTVLRRVLLPAQLTAPNPLGPGQEWSTAAPMALSQSASRVAGYRVLAFYP